MSELLSDIRSRIETLGMGFQFTGTMKTKTNGIERETWLLEYEGSQFVFVAGQKDVILGWDVAGCPLGEGVLSGLRDEFAAGHAYYQETIEDLRDYYQKKIVKAEAADEMAKAEQLRAELAEEVEGMQEEQREAGCENWDDFMSRWNENLSRCLSPLRTADIGDMLVEVDSRYLEEDAPSLEEAVTALKQGPFTLATEDEWEYLCNGGARTLFRWGDTLDRPILEEIFSTGSVSARDEKKSDVLQQANMLGLFIAYDSYKCELIDHSAYTKGGDGGCSLCGGDGAIFVLPCYTAFYRHRAGGQNRYLSKHYYCYRRIIRLP